MEEIAKRKSTGVLGKMIENMDENSLEKTRQKMCTPEDYTNYLVDAFDTGKMTLQEVIAHAMDYASVKNDGKVYAITHCGYEYDDLGYPDLTVDKLYLTKEERDAALEELIEKQLEWFNKCKSEYEKMGGNPEEYEIVDLGNLNETVVRLELSMKNWCYQWGIAEYRLSTFKKKEDEED